MFNKRHYETIALVMQDMCPELPEDDEGNYDDNGYDHDALGRQLMWDDMCDRLADAFELAQSAINGFALWAQASRFAYLKATGLELEPETVDEIPF